MAVKMSEEESRAMIDEIVAKSRKAFEKYEFATQEQADAVCKAIARAVFDHAEELAKLAIEETGIGNLEGKINKNTDVPSGMWNDMKGKKSVGVVFDDKEHNMLWIAKPRGVCCCVSPATNPTITPMGNSMQALKCRNTMIISPHPRALETSTRTVKYMREAIEKVGFPADLIQVVADPSNYASQYLMSQVDTVIATGGSAMVHAAYSSGKPAFGVGPGNMQCLIAPDYKDFDKAAQDIINGRSFDWGSVCAGDQICIIQKNDEQAMIDAFRRNGAYVVEDEKDVAKFRESIFTSDGHTRGELVAHSPQVIADAAGVAVPKDAKIIVVKVHKYGADEPLCWEKLCPVTALITYDTVDEAMEIAKANVKRVGIGHSSTIHSNDNATILKFAEMMPVGRIIVNEMGPSAAGAGSLNFFENTVSIGTGAWGGNSISTNLTWKDLYQVTRIGYPRAGGSPSFEERWADPQ